MTLTMTSLSVYQLAFCFFLCQLASGDENICSRANFQGINSNLQPTILTDPKQNALYLTIHLNWTENLNKTFLDFLNIQKHVENLTKKTSTIGPRKLLAGVGFGPRAIKWLNNSYSFGDLKPFPYITRKGPLGDLPSTDGDIFVHAKSDDHGILFELTELLLNGVPNASIAKADDVYGWTYRNGRDLSGFVDGTANAKTLRGRCLVAIDQKSLGSYAITQQWIHNLSLLAQTKTSVKESWIGRTLKKNIEFEHQPPGSHVSQMSPLPPIYRQSQPWGTFTKDAGLFFIAYVSDPGTFDLMLDRMTAQDEKHVADSVMNFSRSVTGAYWYFPSQAALNKLATCLSNRA